MHSRQMLLWSQPEPAECKASPAKKLCIMAAALPSRAAKPPPQQQPLLWSRPDGHAAHGTSMAVPFAQQPSFHSWSRVWADILYCMYIACKSRVAWKCTCWCYFRHTFKLLFFGSWFNLADFSEKLARRICSAHSACPAAGTIASRQPHKPFKITQ